MSLSSQPVVASTDNGSFTRPAPLQNSYTSDTGFQRVLSWYLPPEVFHSIEPRLTLLGAEAVSSQILKWSADAETQQPYFKSYDVWGVRYQYDRLVTSEGWKQLKKWGARSGAVSLGYDPRYGIDRRMVQYAVNYLYSPSSGLTSCPISMTDGAASILSQRLQNLPSDHIFHTVFKKLTSAGDDHWTSGQWMSERAGGSDVQNAETWAVYSPIPPASKTSDVLSEGDYLVSGFKFFSSATDSDVVFVLAKTSPGKLSTFLAPLRRTVIGEDGRPSEVSNGVRINRLKNKLGTKELPTAEVELKDMRAHLVGELDQGIVTIAPLLNVSRIQTLFGSLAAWRRAINIAKGFSKARTTVNEPLWLIPMHLRVLSDLEMKHAGAINLAFFTIAVMGHVENNVASRRQAHLPSCHAEANVILRVLTATAKAVVSKASVLAIVECQEALGGIGYMDETDEPEFNISRILRNTVVNSIWEGTTNILASELVRFLLKEGNLRTFKGWLDRTISLIQDQTHKDMLNTAWLLLLSRLEALRSPKLMVAEARPFMFTLEWIISGALLSLDAQRDGNPVATEIARRWILLGEGGVVGFTYREIVKGTTDPMSPEERIQWDCRMTWGVEYPTTQVWGHRSLQGNGCAKL